MPFSCLSHAFLMPFCLSVLCTLATPCEDVGHSTFSFETWSVERNFRNFNVLPGPSRFPVSFSLRFTSSGDAFRPSTCWRSDASIFGPRTYDTWRRLVDLSPRYIFGYQNYHVLAPLPRLVLQELQPNSGAYNSPVLLRWGQRRENLPKRLAFDDILSRRHVLCVKIWSTQSGAGFCVSQSPECLLVKESFDSKKLHLVGFCDSSFIYNIRYIYMYIASMGNHCNVTIVNLQSSVFVTCDSCRPNWRPIDRRAPVFLRTPHAVHLENLAQRLGWDICQVGRTSWSCCLCRVHWACPSLKTFAQRSSKPCLETRQSRHDRISNGYSESAIIYPPTPHSPIEYNHHSMSSHSILRNLPSPCLFCLFGHDIRGHCTPRCPSQQTPESHGTLRKK